MILNLTEVEYPGDEVVGPDEDDAQILFGALADIDQVEEAALIISRYEAHMVIVDVSDDYFVILREELPNSELVLGVNYECA